MRQLTHPKLCRLLQLTACGNEILPHPRYSPDLVPSDFYLFPKLKIKLRGRRFGSNEGIIEAVNEFIEDQNREFYFEGLNMSQHRWANCIVIEGDYIET
jgi:histone-lysine N-methyltransferase SETMAR